MAALVQCNRCGTPLLTSLDLNPLDASRSLIMSNLVFRGNGYALNVCRSPHGTCPICGKSSQWEGSPQILPGDPVRVDIALDEKCLAFLFRHSEVHLREDYSLNSSRIRDGHYYLAHSALRHFVLGGTLSIFNRAIGAIALASESSSIASLRHLCSLIRIVTKEEFSPYQLIVETFQITEGFCTIVTLPIPQQSARTFMVGIVTNSVGFSGAEKPKEDVVVLYFTLERTSDSNEVARTFVGEWRRDGSHRNYGIGPNPRLEDFVECLHRIWVSGVWK